jgi:hypothetical protein
VDLHEPYQVFHHDDGGDGHHGRGHGDGGGLLYYIRSLYTFSFLLFFVYWYISVLVY